MIDETQISSLLSDQKAYRINAISKGLDILGIENDDIIIMSNINEIINPKIIKELKIDSNKIYKLKQKILYIVSLYYNLIHNKYSDAIVIKGSMYPYVKKLSDSEMNYDLIEHEDDFYSGVSFKWHK